MNKMRPITIFNIVCLFVTTAWAAGLMETMNPGSSEDKASESGSTESKSGGDKDEAHDRQRRYHGQHIWDGHRWWYIPYPQHQGYGYRPAAPVTYTATRPPQTQPTQRNQFYLYNTNPPRFTPAPQTTKYQPTQQTTRYQPTFAQTTRFQTRPTTAATTRPATQAPLPQTTLAPATTPKATAPGQPIRVDTSCSGDWAKLAHSTMCEYQDSPSATQMGVSEADKQEILRVHNMVRGKVHQDDGVRASNMQKMYWDDKIAQLAQKWVQVCIAGHDKNEQRKVPGYNIQVGQNWAQGQASWTEAIMAWYDEYKYFTYNGKNNVLKVIGHFTQVVKHDAARVGCGFAMCGGRKTYVCDYAFGNAYDLGVPYKSGSTCDKCPGHCRDNLCDCGGKICLNGGTLDLNTCQCKCQRVYKGSSCEIVDCTGIKDPSYCGRDQPVGFPASFCTKYSNVPIECPHMCGLCPKV